MSVIDIVMPIHVVYLSTTSNTPTWNQSVPVDRSNLSSVKWCLNWDEIFRGQNQKYKYCRLRAKLLSSSFTANVTDWDTYLGYLTCNIPSLTSGFGTYGTVIAPVTAQDVPTTASTHYIYADTTNEPGIDIMVPTGNNDFILTFNRMDLSSGLRTSNIYDYQVFLYFELYDEK